MIERTDWWDLLRDAGNSDSPDVGVLGLPFDGGVCYRKGAALAPAKLRELSRTSSAVTESGRAIERLRIADFGDVTTTEETVAHPHLYFERVAERLNSLQPPPFLLCLGGDHSTLIPVARWVQRWGTAPWGIVHIDAHPDLFSIYEKSPLSHACALRRTLELPNFHPQRCALVGARSFSPFETEFIRTAGMPLITAKDLQARGTAAVVEEVCHRLQDARQVLISLDIDAADPAFAPGTGIPAAGGLSSRDLLTLMEGFIKKLPVRVLCLVEIAPPLDVSDITSFLGVQIIMEVFGHLEERWSTQ